MGIKLNQVLAELSKGFKPGVDHTSRTLALAQSITYAMRAQQIIEDPPLNIKSGLTLAEMTIISINKDEALLKITRGNFIQ
jgi:hypothetical protein